MQFAFRSEILDFDTILPQNPQEYDNLQPPKEKGDATVVRFHVTVLSLDTIDEGSMVNTSQFYAFSISCFKFRQQKKEERNKYPMYDKYSRFQSESIIKNRSKA
ncbi:uncharacterized protein NPIL_405271 [Nephila pilipes]|uniref:Uncharacterized protein n=1 Tax=Nephila pilipes TaxID=299642 RepID=A0A8X6MG96_NEPPI|nr:uncharacterized protein NPIL_405271 [Nephila pilipes]